MYTADATRLTAFSTDSIEEVSLTTSSDVEQFYEQEILIESFSQPYPLRARGEPVADGEMDSYG